jgi:two-component system, OmpR family, response regulator
VRPHVLVVEDMPGVRELVVASLQKGGYSVTWAEDLASATEALACEPVDLLITDDALPDGSGHVLARSARGAHPDLRVLLLAEPGEGEASSDAALPKPFDSAELLERVRELCPIASAS